MPDEKDKKFTITNYIATAAILVSLSASVGSAVTSCVTSKDVQRLQARDADLRAFEDAAKQLQEAGASYVNALNEGSDLSVARDKISAILARQSIAALNLKPKLKSADEQYISEYIDALRDLNNTSRKISKPEDFRLWAESYGRTVDTGSSLAQAVSASTGQRG